MPVAEAPKQPVAEAPKQPPMASFARMLPGSWRVTNPNGTSQTDTWYPGPGDLSLRVETDGTDGSGSPWRELVVLFWHPGRAQVRLLGFNPYARSVAEGHITFAGDSAEAEIVMHQTPGRRDLVQRWSFAGPDNYREALLERRGAGGLGLLAEWDYFRVPTPAAIVRTDPPPTASERLQDLVALVGPTWQARGEWAGGGAFDLQTSFTWIPYADVIHARTTARTESGESKHLLDAYLYHHTGADQLRCLALSDRGGVYEGDVTVHAGGALQLDLKGHEDDRATLHAVRLEFEPDGALRQRVWSLAGDDRTLVLDARHERRERQAE
ncbi:hypothetical protein [Nannocystis bainbridge]|uniref:hypothetical protein n=1 Tax=Nannocystis bainbridge TaxID=2995303 RepID=UPI00232FED91|nr:hypothetical protein [Nannocystis bainbridge]